MRQAGPDTDTGTGRAVLAPPQRVEEGRVGQYPEQALGDVPAAYERSSATQHDSRL